MTNASMYTDSNLSFVSQDDITDVNVTETYMGEWKNDKRSGFGISERSDGLKYEGEWFNNRKYGYGITTHRGQIEEGKYKNNVLVTSTNKRHMFLIRSAKFRERIDSALNAAQRASKIALQKADIAISRTATARGKAEQSDIAAVHAREDAQYAVNCAKDYGAEDSTTTGLDLALPGLEANNVASMMASKHVANNLLSVKTNTATAANNNRPRTPTNLAPPSKSNVASSSSSSLQPSKPSPTTPSLQQQQQTSAQIQQPPRGPSPRGINNAPTTPQPPVAASSMAPLGTAAASSNLGPNMSSSFNSNNVMQRPSVSSMMRSMQPPQQQPPMASAVTMASPSTNCDISNT